MVNVWDKRVLFLVFLIFWFKKIIGKKKKIYIILGGVENCGRMIVGDRGGVICGIILDWECLFRS